MSQNKFLETPRWAVIFISELSSDTEGYTEMGKKLQQRLAQFPGFLGVESLRTGKTGITISFWRDQESIARWREDPEHQEARRMGRERWYQNYTLLRVRVEEVKKFQKK